MLVIPSIVSLILSVLNDFLTTLCVQQTTLSHA
jgi:hypothetical protein